MSEPIEIIDLYVKFHATRKQYEALSYWNDDTTTEI